MKSALALLAACAVLLVAPIAGPAVPQNFGRPRTWPIGMEPNVWPGLSQRVGPYGGIETLDDARRLTADGLNLNVLSASNAPLLKSLRDGGVSYIDPHLWGFINQVCQAQFARQRAIQQAVHCELSDADQAGIARQASAYLLRVQRDPGLVGFWILDDYPHGTIAPMLAQLHELVRESNAASGFRRPTLCGVGGRLDYKRSVADVAFIKDWQYLDNALTNVSTADCDIVSPYFYGVAGADNPRLVDWSMRDLLPYFRQALARKHYDELAQTMLPIAHAFAHHAADSVNYHVQPAPDDIATQMKAYCDGGAFAMMFFTWQSADATRSYSNDASLREGVQAGRAACVSAWSRRSVEAVP
jgi:hypothetical protein